MLDMLSDDGVECRSFCAAGGDAEHYITVSPRCGGSFETQLKSVQTRYADAVRSLGLGPETAIFRRLFLSDVMNQAALVRNSELAMETDDNPVAVSIVQQPPLAGQKVSLLAYHVASSGRLAKKRFSMKHLLVKKDGRRHLWSTRLSAGAFDPSPCSDAQTRKIFDGLVDVLSDLGGSLASNCVRTWIYLRNVDVFYQGMVDSRRALFAAEGLTNDTHYIASTGIEGACCHRYDVVSMDAYSILDLDPRQISYLNDFNMLCATKDYRVTFERGAKIAYADRAHFFISGTASIDSEGNVLHAGDVARQLDRAIVNVEALLQAGGARLGDLTHLIVYLRDPADYPLVKQSLGERFPGLPMPIVLGAVCRPEWLVEIEGAAAAENKDPSLPSF
jgi:enamine deaminase RidA (YjgF/YER057c/UK114 family)